MDRPRSQLASFACAARGIWQTLRTQLHAQVEAIFAIVALALCCLLHVDAMGWCLVILCIGVVFAAEIINTALEALCDKVCPEEDSLIRVAKDAAAGAVLVLACASAIIGLIIFISAALHLAGM